MNDIRTPEFADDAESYNSEQSISVGKGMSTVSKLHAMETLNASSHDESMAITSGITREPEFSDANRSLQAHTIATTDVNDAPTDAKEHDHPNASAAWSEIPVVQAFSSKMVVDTATDWSGFIASPSPQEESENIRALRQSLESDLKNLPYFIELTGDIRLLRFLRGHKSNVSVAAEKYREMLLFRKKYDLDIVRSHIVNKSLQIYDFPHYERIRSFIPFAHAFEPVQRAGADVFSYFMTGYTDWKGLSDNILELEWMEFLSYELEYRAIQLDSLSRAQESMVQTYFVHDLRGFTFGISPKIFVLLQKTAQFAVHYPETTRATLILRAPWIFHRIWRSLSPFLQESQLKKFDMRGPETFHRLLNLVHREQLPSILGGSNKHIAVPQTGNLGKDSFVLLCEEGACQADIPRQQMLQLPYRIGVNDTICWEFQVETYDIQFFVQLRVQGEQDGAMEKVKVEKVCIPCKQRITGEYTATEEGTIVLVWDNSYSWTRSKRLAYKAKIIRATHDFGSHLEP